MSNQDGYYYLHTNGELIWKKFDPGEDHSDFVRKVWGVSKSERGSAWTIVLEALALGAKNDRIKELADHWHLSIIDCMVLIRRVPPSELMKKGLPLFSRLIFEKEEEEFWEYAEKAFGVAYGKEFQVVKKVWTE